MLQRPWLGGVIKKGRCMAYKFAVGQSVEYTPVGGKLGLFQVVRCMPIEPQQDELRYRITSDSEGFERIVLEYDLDVATPGRSYAPPTNVRRTAAHHG
jgi:hypothetical protein